MRGKVHSLDMVQGPLLPQLIRFSLPLMATSLLQLFYNAADMVVVGRFAGAESLAAVGSTGALINLITNLFVGFSLGANVAIAHANGAQDQQAIRRNVHTAVTLSVICGLIVMTIGLIFARPMLQWMGSPEDVIDKATLYVQIFFLGMPVNLLYNFGAGIMRAVGDTKRPLFYLSIAGLANVALNLLLVIVLRMDVAGVAIATVVSQLLSAIFVMQHLLRTHESIHVDMKKLGLDWKCVKEIVRIGLPAGIQSSLFSLSNVIIQSSVNAQGSVWMAGNAAAANVEGFVWVSMNSISQGTLTFSSANRGAREFKRVRKVLAVSLTVVGLVGLAVGLTAWAFGGTLVGFYNSEAAVIEKGMVRMGLIMPTYFLCGLMDVAGSQMRGMGYSIAPMIVSLSGACAFRLLWVFTIFAADPRMTTLYVSYPISWFLTFLCHMGCYFCLARPKLMRQEKALSKVAG